MEIAFRRVSDRRNPSRFLEEARFLWELRNEPETRLMSLGTSPIPWEEHLDWFSRAVADSSRTIVIVQCDSRDIGMLRLDGDTNDRSQAVMSVALVPDFRGRGLGVQVIQQGIREAGRLGFRTVIAHIRRENGRSIRAFQSAGFVADETDTTGEVARFTVRLSEST